MQHLIHGASAVLLGPPQVVDQLKALPDYSTVVKRVVPAPAEPGAAVESTVRGLVIRSGVLYHQADPQRKNQNFGFSFNLAGLRLLHVGDCDFDQITALKTLKPPGEAIDIAFLNCNWFDDPNFASARRMIDYIQPKAIVLMHVGVGEADSYRTLIGKMRDLPPVYLANSPMEKLKFRLVAGQLSVDHIPLQRETPLAAAPRP
jgi:L-ascorbate metabolism protein UlaG (beta-lactamase superfamily)